MIQSVHWHALCFGNDLGGLVLLRDCKGVLMDQFQALLECEGNWTGSNRIQTTPTDTIQESISRLAVTPILNRTFLRIDQEWSWEGQPQSGSFLIGNSHESKQASVHWIDSWHNGVRVMPLVGGFENTGEGKCMLVVNGTFPVEPGVDWGWRITFQFHGEQLKIDMVCLPPEGFPEVGWVWSEFQRI